MDLKSKKGVSASIESQEAQNEKLRAQGEQDTDKLKMSEAQRMQQADVSGKQFVFETQEDREKGRLNRAAGLADRAAMHAQQASAASTTAWAGVATTSVGAVSSGAFDKD
jgi:hypothetical protein